MIGFIGFIIGSISVFFMLYITDNTHNTTKGSVIKGVMITGSKYDPNCPHKYKKAIIYYKAINK